MTALAIKELRTLLPLYLLLAFLFSGDFLTRPWTERLDEHSWLSVASDVGPGGDVTFGIILGIFSIMVAYAAYPREHDERTIELLHALPIGRWTVFFVKVTCGIAVLWLAMLGGAFTNFLLQVTNTQSFWGDQWNAVAAGQVVLLRGALLTAMYGHGLLASFFRRFGLLPLFLIAIAVSWLTRLSPVYALANPTDMLAHQYDGSAVDFPWLLVAVHLALGLGSLLTGGALWVGLGPRAGSALHEAQSSLFGRLSLGCGTSLVVVVGFTFFVVAAAPSTAPAPDALPVDTDREETPTAAGQTAVVRETTECCTLSYRERDRARAEPLIAGADAIFREVSRTLGRPRGLDAPTVAVDMTAVSGSHLGVASFDRMRVGLGADQTPEALAHTFAHEAAHTVQHLILATDANDPGIGLLLEGGAEWTASRVTPDPARERHAWRIAAALQERYGLEFSDVLDEEAFRRHYGMLMGYPVGETWTWAIAEGCGGQAPGALLEAIADDQEVTSPSLWGRLSDKVACEERALARWTERVEATRAEERRWLDALPELGAHVVGRDDGSWLIRAYADRPLPEDAVPVVAVRRQPKSDLSDVRGARGQVLPGEPPRDRGAVTIEFRVPSGIARVGRLEVQLGLEVDGRRPPVLQPWQSLEVP